ncbi:MAG: lipoate--protein ligase family protein [Chloroflexi bacterium]|nr:lipoate--protein ligase family protein [Chloroflexota bacterium]MBU1750873.1 lipoate--protein ligase family protein [Chloroflexota bacterium]
MNLYDLGHVPWLHSQLVYHALPRLQREGLVILAPAQPYVCIGYHQDAAQEVNLAYCRTHYIPIFRREVGGGAVYLDGDQLFYQLVIYRDNPLIPRGGKDAFYRHFLAPVVAVYRQLGVDARYRPVNDIVTAEGRKISGNGAADMGDYTVLVGNLILDFDYDTMARVLKVPDEKYRDKVHATMRENLTTLRRELPVVPSYHELAGLLARQFAPLVGALEPAELDAAVYDMVDELAPRFTSDEWLLKRGKRHAQRERRVRIAAGVDVIRRVHKTPGGLIRGDCVLQDGQLRDVSLSGDFFFYPADRLAALEQALEGVPAAEAEAAIARFYAVEGIESPGVTPADLAQVFRHDR